MKTPPKLPRAGQRLQNHDLGGLPDLSRIGKQRLEDLSQEELIAKYKRDTLQLAKPLSAMTLRVFGEDWVALFDTSMSVTPKNGISMPGQVEPRSAHIPSCVIVATGAENFALLKEAFEIAKQRGERLEYERAIAEGERMKREGEFPDVPGLPDLPEGVKANVVDGFVQRREEQLQAEQAMESEQNPE